MALRCGCDGHQASRTNADPAGFQLRYGLPASRIGFEGGCRAHRGEPPLPEDAPAPSTIGDLAFRLSLDAIVLMDSAGLVTGWNAAAEALLGWTAAEAIGSPVRDLIVPEQYRDQHDAGLQRFRETGAGPVLGQVLDILTGLRRDGTEFPLEIRISHGSGEPARATFVAFLRDISARKWAERNLQARYAVTKAIASRSSWDEVVQLVLDAASEQLGYPVAEVWLLDEAEMQLRWEAGRSRPGFDARPLRAAGMENPLLPDGGMLARAWTERTGVRGGLDEEPEPRRRAAQGCGLGTMVAAPLFGGDTALGVVAFYRPGEPADLDAVALDVVADLGVQLGQHLERVRIEQALRHARERMHTELEHRARTDGLTGVVNRAGFDEALQDAVAAGRRRADQFALLLLDLDEFKSINDTQGHAAGDRLLLAVASHLTEALRSSDVVARVGGDEFAVLSGHGCDVEAARDLARKIHETLATIQLDATEARVSASIGIALFPAHGADATSLWRNADAAMYLAKRTRSGQAMYRDGLPPGRGASTPLTPSP